MSFNQIQTPTDGDTPLQYNAKFKSNAKLLANSYNGLSKNPIKHFAPVIAPEAWQTGTVYYNGDFVSSNGKYYMNRGGGTSGATDPSHTTAAPVSDGGTSWYFMGQAETATGVDVPTYTLQARDAGHTKYWQASSVTYKDFFTFTGGTYTVNGSGIRLPSTNVSPATGNSVGNFDSHNGAAHFYTDADTFTIQGYSVWYADNAFSILIDGIPLFLGNVAPAVTTNPCGLNLDYSAYPRKVRKVSVYFPGNGTFHGVYTKPSDRVWAVEEKHKIVFCGDSLTAGANAFPAYQSGDVATTIGSLLGTENVWNTGSGGCGFINDNSGTKTNHNDRLSDFTNPNPDTLVVMGVYNDAGYTDVAQVNAYTQFLNGFRAACPSCRIIVFGTCYGAEGSTTSYENADNNMETAINNIGDDNTFWIPIATSDSPWIFGTGKDTSQNGTGNSDFFQSSDSTHPNQNGIYYRAVNYAKGIAEALGC